ncbi:hypothetical protein R6Q59_003716 [Mikania micrantha]
MEYIPKHVLCSCGYPATTRTSWTSTNPGRHCCARNAGGCGFIGWRDPPMCSRSVDIIPAFLERRTCMRKLLGGLFFKTVF